MKKNATLISLAGHETIPVSLAKTGTITTKGVSVYGTATKFLSQVQPGDWIYDSSQDEVQQVKNVVDDTNLVLATAFTADIAGAIALKVSQSIYTFVQGTFAAAGQVDNVAAPAGTYVWNKGGRDRTAARDFIDPLCIDSTGTTATFSVSI